MPHETGLERLAPARRRSRQTARWSLAVLGLFLATARCTFPEYDVVPQTVGGASAKAGDGGDTSGRGGSGATSNRAGSSQGGALDMPAGAPGSAGAVEPSGGAGDCGPDQWPVEQCPGACLDRFPDHCYDLEQSGDEIALDCGGSCQACTNEACTNDSDCLSGRCVSNASGASSCYAPLGIRYTAHERSASVSSTAWSIKLSNNEPIGGHAYFFKDIKLRYYFERTGIVEPLIVRATQSNLQLESGEARDLKLTSWSIERTESTADVAYDAYVEVGFSEGGQLFPGDSLDLYQQMLTGDNSSSNFDQRANYSFTDQTDSAFLHIVVLYQDRLVWGLEPRPANPRQCFARGVNLNGPALTVAGNAWQSSLDANVAPGGGTAVSQATTLFPAATGALATMMQTSFTLATGNELSMPVDNGSYLLYLYGVSPGASNDATSSTFTVQGAEPEETSEFRAQTAEGGQVWARMGPLRADVTDGQLRVGVTAGAVSFAGLELWYRD